MIGSAYKTRGVIVENTPVAKDVGIIEYREMLSSFKYTEQLKNLALNDVKSDPWKSRAFLKILIGVGVIKEQPGITLMSRDIFRERIAAMREWRTQREMFERWLKERTA